MRHRRLLVGSSSQPLRWLRHHPGGRQARRRQGRRHREIEALLRDGSAAPGARRARLRFLTRPRHRSRRPGIAHRPQRAHDHLRLRHLRDRTAKTNPDGDKTHPAPHRRDRRHRRRLCLHPLRQAHRRHRIGHHPLGLRRPIHRRRIRAHLPAGPLLRPTTAQFITVDPAFTTTLAPYSYANDNPINMIDPTGLCLWYNLYCEAVQPAAHFVWHHRGAFAAGLGACRTGCSHRWVRVRRRRRRRECPRHRYWHRHRCRRVRPHCRRRRIRNRQRTVSRWLR